MAASVWITWATVGTCERNAGGSSFRSRSDQIRSPNTDRDTHDLVEAGAWKNSGFTNSHTTSAAIGMRHHQPIQSRLQTARARSGTAANLVHTLAGLAWRIHASPLRPKSLAILSLALWLLPSKKLAATVAGHDSQAEAGR
jgi:hypothetical protein